MSWSGQTMIFIPLARVLVSISGGTLPAVRRDGCALAGLVDLAGFFVSRGWADATEAANRVSVRRAIALRFMDDSRWSDGRNHAATADVPVPECRRPGVSF